MFNDEGNMDECNAALVLMSLSASPNSSSQLQGELIDWENGEIEIDKVIIHLISLG